MKKTLSLIFLLSITTTLSANKNWIEIGPSEKAQTKKSNTKIDIDTSQINPMDLLMKNAIAIQELLDTTSKKEEPVNDKNWILLHNEENN